MLFNCSRWQIAFERNPHREARLLCKNTPNNPDANNPPQPHVIMVGAQYGPDGIMEIGAPPTQGQISATRNVTETSREKIKDVLNETKEGTAGGATKDSAEKNQKAKLEETAEKFRSMSAQLSKIHTITLDKDVMDIIQELNPENKDKIFHTLATAEAQKNRLLRLEDAALRIHEWMNQALQPHDFRAFLERFLSEDPAKMAEVLSKFDAAAAHPGLADKVKQWNDGVLTQESDKIEVVQTIWNAINGEEFMNDVDEYQNEWGDYFEKLEVAMDKVKEIKKKRAAIIEANKVRTGEIPDRPIFEMISKWRQEGIMGMTVYSPMEVIRAIQKVGTAIKEAHEDYLNKNANKLAFMLGTTLAESKIPFGEAVQTKMNSTLEGEFGKEKNDFKGELEDDDFNTLRNKFHQFRYDPPKAIGILEVAASHGWLYELTDLTDEPWPLFVMGENLTAVAPMHWDETQIKNYAGTLTRSNTSGGNDQRKKGYDRIKEQQDTDVYVKKFRTLLDNNDYWQAIGVGEALLDRGKMAEASEFLTATIVNHLRTNKDAKKFMTKTVIEQFAIIKWNEATTFSQNTIAMNMDAMNEMRENPNVMNGPLLSTIDALEKEILEANQEPLPKEELARLTGKILSGQTETVNGTAISIYKNKYRQYWDESQNIVFGTYKGDAFVKKISTDYYTDASILQLPISALKAIYNTGSTGQLSAEDFAINFAGYSIRRLEELQKSNPEAADVFKEMMKDKLTQAFQSGFTDKAAEHFINVNWKQGNLTGDPMIADLIHHGLLDKKDILSFAKGKSKYNEFKEALEIQLRNLRAGIRKRTKQKAAPSGPPNFNGPK